MNGSKKYRSSSFTWEKRKWSQKSYKSPYQRKNVIQNFSDPKIVYYYNPLRREWGSRIVEVKK